MSSYPIQDSRCFLEQETLLSLMCVRFHNWNGRCTFMLNKLFTIFKTKPNNRYRCFVRQREIPTVKSKIVHGIVTFLSKAICHFFFSYRPHFILCISISEYWYEEKIEAVRCFWSNNIFVSIAMDTLHLATLNMLRLGCVVPAQHTRGGKNHIRYWSKTISDTRVTLFHQEETGMIYLIV